jgi:hypothetical protein
MSNDLLPSEDLFPFPFASIREGVDGRRRKMGADVGDLDPSSRVGASTLRREWVGHQWEGSCEEEQ